MRPIRPTALSDELTSRRDRTRERIVASAADLLAQGGPDAVSTRAVSSASGVQPPTLYRLFGDKQGLLDAVAAYGLERYFQQKITRGPTGDPVDDLRAGWDLHVSFGLTNPALYSLIYGEPRQESSPAAAAAADVLAQHIHRIAQVGRLRVPEGLAAHLVHAAGCGTTLTLICMPAEGRDTALSATAREAVIAAITTDSSATDAFATDASATDAFAAGSSETDAFGADSSATDSSATGAVAIGRAGPTAAAIALRSVVRELDTLTVAERTLLAEWLDRIATR